MVIVNQPGRRISGRTRTRSASAWPCGGATIIEAEVVGVVGDVRLRTLDTAPGHNLYWPQAQLPNSGMTVVLRTSVPPAELAASAREAVASVDPAVPVSAGHAGA